MLLSGDMLLLSVLLVLQLAFHFGQHVAQAFDTAFCDRDATGTDELQDTDRFTQFLEQGLRLVVMAALFQNHARFVHFQNAGVIFADQVLDRPHLDEQFGAQLIKGYLLKNQVFVRVIIGFQDIHSLVDLLHDLVDRIFIGECRDRKLMYTLYGGRRNGKRLDVQLPARKDLKR